MIQSVWFMMRVWFINLSKNFTSAHKQSLKELNQDVNETTKRSYQLGPSASANFRASNGLKILASDVISSSSDR